MSERTRNQPAGRQPRSKAERRLALAVAAKEAAARRRKQRNLITVGAGVAVGVLLIGVFVVFASSGDSDKQAGDKPSASTSATPSNAAFPSLPEGADPALKSKPAATAGKGDLTKLTVTPLVKGTGPAVKAGQEITVNYVGVSYRTGQEFDASWNRAEPFSFPLGAGNVIPGWDQGLVGVNVGSRVQLDIPADLAYGENPGGGRPGGPLRFIVDVLAVR